MQEKIRANNQKEAIEVDKAIPQIQQGKHQSPSINYNPEYSPKDFKKYVSNIIKLDLCTKNATPYNTAKANAIKNLRHTSVKS